MSAATSQTPSHKKAIAFRAQTDELYEIEHVLSLVQSATTDRSPSSPPTGHQLLFDALMRLAGLPFRLAAAAPHVAALPPALPLAHTGGRLALALAAHVALLGAPAPAAKSKSEKNQNGANSAPIAMATVKTTGVFQLLALSDDDNNSITSSDFNAIALLVAPTGSLTVISTSPTSSDDNNDSNDVIESIIATADASLIAPPDGIVAAAVRLAPECDFADTARCAELLLLGGDGVLRRVHCRRGAPLHPLPFALPGDPRRTACEPVVAPVPLYAWHGSATALAWSGEATRLLAVGGGASGEAKELRFSLSLWRFDDEDDVGRPIPLYSSELGGDSVAEGTSERAGPLAHTFAPLASMRRVRRSLDSEAQRAALHRLAWARDATQLAGADLLGNVFVWRVDPSTGATVLRHAIDGAALDRVSARTPAADESLFVSDVAWWSDSALVVARSNGDVLLINVGRTVPDDEPLRALTAVEHFHAPPLLARGDGGTVFVVVRQADERRVLHRELVDDAPAEAAPGRERVRVSLLRRCSPADLLQRLVARTQYADATALCQRYQLSPSAVLAAQFASTAVTTRSIADLLAPLDVEYQLRACVTRVGETEGGQLALLSRGFELTVPDCVRRALGDVSAQPTMLDAGAPIESVERGVLAALRDVKLGARDIDQCLYRLVLLSQLDRFCTYGRVARLDAASADAHSFNPREFLAFRDGALVDAAARLAQRGNAAALGCVLAHHATECAEQWLALVASLPPSVFDADVLDALLVVADAKQLRSPSMRVWRERDWIERAPPQFVEALGLGVDFTLGDVLRVLDARRNNAAAGGIAGTAASYARNADDVCIAREPRLTQSRFAAALASPSSTAELLPPVEQRVRGKWLAERNCAAVEADIALRWCEARVRWLDAAHGRLDAALAWLSWVAARGLSDERLRRLDETAQQLSAVVYDMPAAAERVDRVLSLAHFEALELGQRVTLLLESASTSVEAMRAVLRAMLGALRADEAVHVVRAADALRTLTSGAHYDAPLSALHAHLVQLATQHSAPRVQHDAAGVALMPFECAAAILIATGSERLANERAIADDSKLMFLALQCAYACPLTDARTLVALNELYNALPSAPRSARTTPADKELDAALVTHTDLFAKHLSAVEVLAQRGMAQPLQFFRDCVQQHQKARTLLRQLAQSLTRQHGATREQWARLRADLLVVCEAVPFIHEKFCLELFCGALLLSREYKLAQEHLAQLEGAEALCLTTARDLVNGCTSLTDESLREARKVLQLVRATPALQQELALIDACERLSALRLPQAVMPPIQVRLTPQPLTLVDAVLQHNDLLYIDAAAVLALARGIGASSDADVFAVRCLLGTAALRANDPETALTHARLLLAGGCKTADAVRLCLATARGMLARNAAASRELAQAVLLRAASDELAEVMAIERLADMRLLASRHNYDGVAKAPEAEFGATLAATVRNFDAALPSRTRVHHAFYGDVFGDALCDDAFAAPRADRRGVAELYLLASAANATATPNEIAALRAHLAHTLRADTAHAVGVLLALARDGVDRRLADTAAATVLEYATNTPGAVMIAQWCAAMAALVAEKAVASESVEPLLALSGGELRARLPSNGDSLWRALLADLDKLQSSSSSTSTKTASSSSNELRALEPKARAAALLSALNDAKDASDVLARVAEPLVQLADAAHADDYSEVALAVLQRLYADDAAEAQVWRERLALKSLPNKAHDDALLALSPLVALTSPHKANRLTGYAAVQQAGAAVADNVCEVLLARCKKDCGVHAVVHFAAVGAVRRALVGYIVARAAADDDGDDGAPRRAADAFAALAHCAIAGQWRTAAQLAMAVSRCGEVGGGLVSGVAATAALLRIGEQRATQRCQRAAERGDVPAEKAWRDDAALLLAAQATCHQ